MKQPFDSPELNSGFQLDASLLTPEQLEHVEAIFKARGVDVIIQDKDATWLLYQDNECGMYHVAQYRWETCKPFNVIDYPTLCRGAVQLEPSMYARFSTVSNALACIEYAQDRSILDATTYENGEYVWVHTDRKTLFQVDTLHRKHKLTEVSPEEFEQKLRGIYPVVRETTETVENPKYLKGIENECVVEFIEENIKGRFKGKIVEKGQQGLPVGYVYDCFFCDQYSPCDYTEQDTPVTEQPKETIADCGKKTLMDNPTIADHIGSHMNLAFDYAKELVNENTRLRAQLYRLPILEQENAQLKDEKESIFRMAANFERENKQLVSDLSAANQRIAAQSQLINNEPKEPVYGKEWLDNCVSAYNSNYFLIHSVKQGMLIAVNTVGIGCPTLSAKDSAPIIMAALAKELNQMFYADPNKSMFCIQKVNGEAITGFSYAHMKDIAHIFTSEQAAQKALSILTEHFPEVLKNYLP